MTVNIFDGNIDIFADDGKLLKRISDGHITTRATMLLTNYDETDWTEIEEDEVYSPVE